MASRTGLILLLLLVVASATAMAAQPPTTTNNFLYGGLVPIDGHDGMDLDVDELMMESETARRQLGYKSRYISYAALRKTNTPCNRRGNSYYNCNNRQRANPYRRGCTRATKCARTY